MNSESRAAMNDVDRSKDGGIGSLAEDGGSFISRNDGSKCDA